MKNFSETVVKAFLPTAPFQDFACYKRFSQRLPIVVLRLFIE